MSAFPYTEIHFKDAVVDGKSRRLIGDRLLTVKIPRNGTKSILEEHINCADCDAQFKTHKSLLTHWKETHKGDHEKAKT